MFVKPRYIEMDDYSTPVANVIDNFEKSIIRKLISDFHRSNQFSEKVDLGRKLTEKGYPVELRVWRHETSEGRVSESVAGVVHVDRALKKIVPEVIGFPII